MQIHSRDRFSFSCRSGSRLQYAQTDSTISTDLPRLWKCVRVRSHLGSRGPLAQGFAHCLCVFVCLLSCVFLFASLVSRALHASQGMERDVPAEWASSVAVGARTQCPPIRGSATRSRTPTPTPGHHESTSDQSSKFGSGVGGSWTCGVDGKDGDSGCLTASQGSHTSASDRSEEVSFPSVSCTRGFSLFSRRHWIELLLASQTSPENARRVQQRRSRTGRDSTEQLPNTLSVLRQALEGEVSWQQPNLKSSPNSHEETPSGTRTVCLTMCKCTSRKFHSPWSKIGCCAICECLDEAVPRDYLADHPPSSGVRPRF